MAKQLYAKQSLYQSCHKSLRKRKKLEEGPHEKLINKTEVVVTSFEPGKDDEEVSIKKGQVGTHLFTTDYGSGHASLRVALCGSVRPRTTPTAPEE